MPVDTSRLDRLIQSQIDRPRARRSWVLRPLRAVAAGIAVVGMIGVMMYALSARPALASADAMAQMHSDLVTGKHHVVKVDSIQEASRALSMNLPDLPAEHVMLCCMQSIQDKRVACVMLKSEDGVPITLAVARAREMRMPASELVTQGEVRYHVQSSGDLNMVMTERNGQWICLIGALEVGRLMEMASQITP